MSRTPGHWHLIGNGNSIYSSKGVCITETQWGEIGHVEYPNSRLEARANAEFIVQACNAYKAATPEPYHDFLGLAASPHETSGLAALIEKIESYPFESEGGDLHNCRHWQQLKNAVREIEFLCDGRADIDANGGPNLAMQIMQVVAA